MLGIRTLLGLEPTESTLASVEDAILPYWMGTLTVKGIPGRWGRANVVAKGDDKAMLSVREIYEQELAAREELGRTVIAA